MDAEKRYEFFEFVRDQWGSQRAGQLMDMLPPSGASELVTKQDLQLGLSGLGAALRQEIADVRVEMHEGFARLYEKMSELTRTIVIAMITLWISGLALAFAAARLAG